MITTSAATIVLFRFLQRIAIPLAFGMVGIGLLELYTTRKGAKHHDNQDQR